MRHRKWCALPARSWTTLASGANTASVTAVSSGGTATTDTYPITISSAASTSLTYDANGNMTSDGTNGYAWDAEDRLITITYSGSGNHSDFTYDGLGRCVKIVETVASSVTSTKQFVWCGARCCEVRDGSGSLANGNQYFALGQVSFSSGTGTNYSYTKDHLSSVREITNSSGTIQSQFSFDPYGIPTQIAGSGATPDFGYAGMYQNQRSGLNLTMFRAYNPQFGRWLSRDPAGDVDLTTNPYEYAANNPISFIDPLGLQPSLGTIRNSITGQSFTLEQGNSGYGLTHIIAGHAPGSVPTGNTEPRGVFFPEAWEPPYMDRMMEKMLGACPGNPNVSVEHSANRRGEPRDLYTANMAMVTRDAITREQIGPPRPIGYVFGPNGGAAVPTSNITIVVNPVTGNIITAYPSLP